MSWTVNCAVISLRLCSLPLNEQQLASPTSIGTPLMEFEGGTGSMRHDGATPAQFVRIPDLALSILQF
jgi:hypothetical protein